MNKKSIKHLTFLTKNKKLSCHARNFIYTSNKIHLSHSKTKTTNSILFLREFVILVVKMILQSCLQLLKRRHFYNYFSI